MHSHILLRNQRGWMNQCRHKPHTRLLPLNVNLFELRRIGLRRRWPARLDFHYAAAYQFAQPRPGPAIARHRCNSPHSPYSGSPASQSVPIPDMNYLPSDQFYAWLRWLLVRVKFAAMTVAGIWRWLAGPQQRAALHRAVRRAHDGPQRQAVAPAPVPVCRCAKC
jgi:hypothetical protein